MNITFISSPLPPKIRALGILQACPYMIERFTSLYQLLPCWNCLHDSILKYDLLHSNLKWLERAQRKLALFETETVIFSYKYISSFLAMRFYLNMACLVLFISTWLIKKMTLLPSILRHDNKQLIFTSNEFKNWLILMTVYLY